MIGINTASMRNYWDVKRRGQRYDASCFGHSATPSNVWLKDVDCSTLEQFSKAPTGIFMLASCEKSRRDFVLDLLVAFILIRWKKLLDPFHIVRLHTTGQLDGVGYSE